MMRTLVALFVTLALAGTALAVPPLVSPRGRKRAVPSQERPTARVPVGEDERPRTRKWQGTGRRLPAGVTPRSRLGGVPVTRTLVALFVTLVLAGTALADSAVQSQEGIAAREREAEEQRPHTWTWFGMGFESRRLRMGRSDDFPAAPYTGDNAYGGQAGGATHTAGAGPVAASVGSGPGAGPAAPTATRTGGSSFAGGAVTPATPFASRGGTAPAMPTAPRAAGPSFGGGGAAPALPATPGAGGPSFGAGGAGQAMPTAPGGAGGPAFGGGSGNGR